MNYPEMSEGRIKHSYRVGRKMMEAVIEHPFLSSYSPADIFVLGYLHDIGYNFTEISAQHAEVGGGILRRQGYPLWREVYYHGKLDIPYHSKELDLLNWADKTVNQRGEDVTLEERISDIGVRHGISSIQYMRAVRMIEQIKKFQNTWNSDK